MHSSSSMLGGRSAYNSVCEESLKFRKKNVRSSVGVWEVVWSIENHEKELRFFFIKCNRKSLEGCKLRRGIINICEIPMDFL